MGITGKRFAVAATVITLAPTFAAAQTGGGEGNPGGFQIDIGLTTGLTYDSNLSLDPGGDSATIWDTGLTVALSSVTPSQRFDFVVGGVLRYIDTEGDSEFGLEDPRARFGYLRESLNSRLEFAASYSDVDRDFLDPFTDVTDESGDSGTVATTDVELRYETGLQEPFGFSVDLTHNKIDYSDTTDPDLEDSQTDRAIVEARMRLSSVSTVTVSADREWYEADDAEQTDRDSVTYLATLRHEMGPTLTLDASLGHTRIETEEFGITDVDSGAVGSIGLTRALGNGTANVLLATRIETTGRRTELTFGREMELPRGSLEAMIGASRGNDGDIDAIGSLTYVQRTRSGELTASVSRSAYADDDDDSVLDTRAAVTYRHEINAVSRLDLGVEWSLVDRSAGGIPDETDFTRVSAAYTRELTVDWDLTGGISHRTRSDTDEGDADSTSVFVTLSRNFSFRP